MRSFHVLSFVLLLLSWYIDECLMKAGSVLRKRCCLHVGGEKDSASKLKKLEEKSRGVSVRHRFIFLGSRVTVWGEVAVAIPDATLFFGGGSAVFFGQRMRHDYKAQRPKDA